MGVVKVDESDFVLADLPGLIEGAHEGIGLGDRFLGHAERCATILHLIDGTGDVVGKTYKTIRAELEAYGMGLDEKPEIVALNKVDAIPEKELAKKIAALEKACGHKVMILSGVTGEGVMPVLRAMMKNIQNRRAHRVMVAERQRPARRPITRLERQNVNFRAPVVPKSMAAELDLEVKVKVKSAQPVIVPKKKKAVEVDKPKRVPLKKKKAVKGGGRAKAKPKPAKHSAKARANKAALNKKRSRR